jgi:nucleotide-binding universal stress UspA family protein
MSEAPYVRPVLVGIDGTPSGLEALSLARALAVLLDAPLVLGAVYGFESVTTGYPGPPWPPKQDALAWLEEAEARLGDALPSRSVSVDASTIAQGLTQLAEQEHAEILVLGSSRRGPFGHLFVGSGVTRVVHGAPCAVAVVPHGWTLRSSKEPLVFGAAVTDAPESREALALAARLAGGTRAQVRVLIAVPMISPAHPLFAATGTSYTAWVRDRRQHAEQMAHEAATGIADAEVEILGGDPVRCLADASSELDLLVVGSRRYGPLRSVLLGGVSGPLVEHAHCPVLIVPRGVRESAPGIAKPSDVAHAS